MQKIDDSIDAFPCTSLTRPGAPYTTQLIWERDTKRLLCWSGSAWRVVARKNHARGKKGYFNEFNTGPTTSGGTENGPYISLTYNPEANRSYMIKFAINAVCTNQSDVGNAQLRLRVATGAVVAKTDPQFYFTWLDYADDGVGALHLGYSGFFAYTEGSSPVAQKTIGMFMWSNTSAVYEFSGACNNVLSIEDVGGS